MIYSVKRVDDNFFRTTIDSLGKEVVNYYTGETDKVIVEPNANLDGGKIYCKSASWIKRGDIIKLNGEWYVVNHLSNLASDVYNCGAITRCDVELKMRMGKFVYEVPAVASKYAGNSNVRGIIDDSVEGKLSFITGYSEHFADMGDNPCVRVFGKIWQIGDYLNVNNVATVYCQGAPSNIKPEICIEPIPVTYKVGDSIDLKVHILNTVDDKIPSDLKITVGGSGLATVNGTNITFKKTGLTTIMMQSGTLGAMYISPEIRVTI
jgi:hypothetical protein